MARIVGRAAQAPPSHVHSAHVVNLHLTHTHPAARAQRARAAAPCPAGIPYVRTASSTPTANTHLDHMQVLKVRELLRRRNLGGVRVGTVDDYQVGSWRRLGVGGVVNCGRRPPEIGRQVDRRNAYATPVADAKSMPCGIDTWQRALMGPGGQHGTVILSNGGSLVDPAALVHAALFTSQRRA